MNNHWFSLIGPSKVSEEGGPIGNNVASFDKQCWVAKLRNQMSS